MSAAGAFLEAMLVFRTSSPGSLTQTPFCSVVWCFYVLQLAVREAQRHLPPHLPPPPPLPPPPLLLIRVPRPRLNPLSTSLWVRIVTRGTRRCTSLLSMCTWSSTRTRPSSRESRTSRQPGSAPCPHPSRPVPPPLRPPVAGPPPRRLMRVQGAPLPLVPRRPVPPPHLRASAVPRRRGPKKNLSR